MGYVSDFEKALAPALFDLADRKRAIGAQAYMKDVAPFIGVVTPERRALVKKIAKEMRVPTSQELGVTARKLWKLDEREFAYAANDLIGIHWNNTEILVGYSDSKEFFIVKAIGWALRDISRFDPRAVRNFLKNHPDLGRVAVREAERGLGRL